MLNTLTGLMNHRKEVHPELSSQDARAGASNATMVNNYCDEGNVSTNGGGAYDAYPTSHANIKRSPSAEAMTSSGICFILFQEKFCNANSDIVLAEKITRELKL